MTLDDESQPGRTDGTGFIMPSDCCPRSFVELDNKEVTSETTSYTDCIPAATFELAYCRAPWFCDCWCHQKTTHGSWKLRCFTWLPDLVWRRRKVDSHVAAITVIQSLLFRSRRVIIVMTTSFRNQATFSPSTGSRTFSPSSHQVGEPSATSQLWAQMLYVGVNVSQ